jgi:hypothetical protein
LDLLQQLTNFKGGRFILGLPSSFSALYRTSHGLEVGIAGRRKVYLQRFVVSLRLEIQQMPSLTDASSRTLLLRNPTRSFVNATASSSKYEEHDGFLRLPSRSAHEQSYRSIVNTNGNSDSDSNSGSDVESSSEDESTPNSHQATLRSINEQLAADPGSISNWLLLLSHTLLNVPTTRAHSEISISILSRALAVTDNSYVLRLKYLQAGEDLWHESKLRAEWEDALRKVNGAGIWMEWFEWRIRKNNTGIAAVVEDAKRAISALPREDVGQMRIFWRLAVAFQNAG